MSGRKHNALHYVQHREVTGRNLRVVPSTAIDTTLVDRALEYVKTQHGQMKMFNITVYDLVNMFQLCRFNTTDVKQAIIIISQRLFFEVGYKYRKLNESDFLVLWNKPEIWHKSDLDNFLDCIMIFVSLSYVQELYVPYQTEHETILHKIWFDSTLAVGMFLCENSYKNSTTSSINDDDDLARNHKMLFGCCNLFIINFIPNWPALQKVFELLQDLCVSYLQYLIRRNQLLM